MRTQKGVTLIELLLVLSALSLALLAVASYSLPWIARESAKSAAYDVQTHMQLARIEAVGRNRVCAMEVNTTTQRLSVWDTQGTFSTLDDEMLYDVTLPDTVSFARPVAGAPVTLGSLSADRFAVAFRSDGTVSAGAGDVVLFGGERYEKITVFWAGGIQVEHWDGSAWRAGS